MNQTQKKFLHDMIPAAVSLVFMSLYMIVDGAFVSILVGADALASINIIYPIADLMFAFGSMYGAGVSVNIAIHQGKGQKELAQEDLNRGVSLSAITGVLLMGIFLLTLQPISVFLGATPRTMEYCIEYGRITCIAIPFGLFKELFLFVLRTDRAQKLSMISSIVGGVINVILDYVFIAVFHMGVAGAAWATLIGMFVGAMIGVCYFLSSKASMHFHFMLPNLSFIRRVVLSGSSNFINNFAAAIITYLYNRVTLPLAGEEGIAAVTIILYAQFLFLSVFTGYMAGAAPILGFNYGAKNYRENQSMFRFCGGLVVLTSILIFAMSQIFGDTVVALLVRDDQVKAIADHGLRLYSWGFLGAGMNLFISGLFTSYGDGVQSGIIAFSRSLVVLGACLLILPRFFGTDGIWYSGVLAELMTLVISMYLLFRHENRKKYQYI